MSKLKIPQSYKLISKTIRFPINVVREIEDLSKLKRISFNKIVVYLLEYSFEIIKEESNIVNNNLMKYEKYLK